MQECFNSKVPFQYCVVASAGDIHYSYSCCYQLHVHINNVCGKTLCYFYSPLFLLFLLNESVYNSIIFVYSSFSRIGHLIVMCSYKNEDRSIIPTRQNIYAQDSFLNSKGTCRL